MREGVAGATGAGAADVAAARWSGRGCFGLFHFEHHLKVWTGGEKRNNRWEAQAVLRSDVLVIRCCATSSTILDSVVQQIQVTMETT